VRAQGYLIITDPEAETKEADTITCCHCNRIVVLKPKTGLEDVGGWCGMCMKGICGPCADLGECTPFERKLEEMERAARLHLALGIGE
jgi:hypothetical protein